MIYEINHIGMLVDDVAEARELYEAALGGREVYQRTRPEGSQILYLQFGGGLVELIGGSKGWGELGLHHLGLLSDDLEGDIARLVEAGGTHLDGPNPGGPGTLATAFVTDPFGIRIELLHRPLEFRRTPDRDRVVDTVDHLSIRVTDPEPVLRFYRDAVGMAVLASTVRESGDGGTLHLGFEGVGKAVHVRPGEGPATEPADFENETLEVHWGPAYEPGIDHVAFRVDDVGAVTERLAGAGYAPEGGSPRAAYSGVGSIATFRREDAEFELLDRPRLRRFLAR